MFEQINCDSILTLDAVKMVQLVSVKSSGTLQLIDEKCSSLQRVGLILPSIQCHAF